MSETGCKITIDGPVIDYDNWSSTVEFENQIEAAMESRGYSRIAGSHSTDQSIHYFVKNDEALKKARGEL
jgi:hypothetical protein